MKKYRFLWMAIVVVVLGVVVCPRIPSSREVDPDRLLDQVLERNPSACFALARTCSFELFGERQGRNTALSLLSSEKIPLPAYSAPRPYYIKLIKRNFTPLVAGEDRIAGRSVWTLRLKPNEKKRPWRQLWVDKKNQQILALRDWSSRDVLNGSMQFPRGKRTMLDRKEAKCTSASSNCSIADALQRASNIIGCEVKEPGYVPSRLELVQVSVDRSSKDVQLTYSDGLYSVSVFYVFGPADFGARDNQIYDCDQGLVTVVRASGKKVVIVADLPEDQIRKMSASIN